MLHPVSFISSLNIYNDSVLICMVLYGCLKFFLSTYSIIAIHSFQHVFFAQFVFAKCIFMLEPNPVAEELATLRNAALQGIEERAAHYAVTNLRRGD